MRCPLCAQECPDDALVCCHCRNDVRVPEALMEENRELKQQVQQLQTELEELQAARTKRRDILVNRPLKSSIE